MSDSSFNRPGFATPSPTTSALCEEQFGSPAPPYTLFFFSFFCRQAGRLRDGLTAESCISSSSRLQPTRAHSEPTKQTVRSDRHWTLYRRRANIEGARLYEKSVAASSHLWSRVTKRERLCHYRHTPSSKVLLGKPLLLSLQSRVLTHLRSPSLNPRPPARPPLCVLARSSCCMHHHLKQSQPPTTQIPTLPANSRLLPVHKS